MKLLLDEMISAVVAEQLRDRDRDRDVEGVTEGPPYESFIHWLQ